MDDRLRDSAVALGVAMQLTNILRDVGEDLENGRVYLPARVLEAASYAPERLRAHVVDGSFRDAWEAVARRSEELYRPMERDVIALDDDSRLPHAVVAVPVPRHLGRGARRRLPLLRADRAVVSKATARELVDEALAALEEGKR